MPTSRRALLLALVAILAVSAAYAEKPVRKPQEVFAPFWSSEPGWDTELQLKNNLTSGPLTVTPVLRLASGEEVPLDPLTIPPNVSLSVWVNEQLLKHSASLLNQAGSYGSVAFRFTSLHAMNLYATAVPTMQGEPITFALKAHPVPLLEAPIGDRRPGSLEGIWWQPRSGLKDVLVISNSSGKKINGTLSLFDAGGKRWSTSLPVAPHQTQRMSVGDLLLKAGLSGSYGGIELDAPASAASLNGVHFMYDEANKFWASLEMFSRDPNATIRRRTGTDAKQWTLRAPMLALRSPDPAVGLPAGTAMQPTIFVRNTTGNKISANLALSWHSDSGKGQVKLPEIEIPPFATRQLPIGALQEQLGIPNDAHWALVTLTTTASPDDLIAIASSHDSSGRYHADTEFSGTVTRHFTGGEWRADANHNQIISVTNSEQKPANALLTLHYDNGRKSYEMQQTILPGEQMWVNVGELMQKRTADRKGNALPADLGFGTYDVKDLGSGPGGLTVSGVALDKTFGYQSAVQSPDCCGFYGDSLNPDSLEVDISGFQNVGAVATNQCTGQLSNILFDITSWSSGNPTIAQVASAQVTGVAPGFTTATGTGIMPVCYGNTLYWEPINPTAPVEVLPKIQQISPPTGQQGTTVPVVISGSGFGSTTGSLTTTAGSQIGVAKGTWSDSTINATFTINSGAAAQSYTVVVTTSSTAACPGCQATTSFYVTAQCNPIVAAKAQTISCDGKTVHEGNLTISGSNESNVTNTEVSAQSSSVLNLDLQGSTYKDSSFCSAGEICYGQNYIGYQKPGAQINWSVQIFCSNSPYPSVTVTPSETITCQ
jgi:hypothetical protein